MSNLLQINIHFVFKIYLNMCFNNELFCLSEIQDILVNSAAFNTNQQLYIRRVVINSNEAIKDCLFGSIYIR